jgi:hypothetical protein
MVDPFTSKVYPFWELLFFLAAIFELAVVPFASCTSIPTIEEQLFMPIIIVDIIWLLHILISSVTAFKIDLELVDKPWPIFKRYLK